MPVSTQETRFLLTARDRTRVVMRRVSANLRDVGRSVTGVKAQLLGLAGIGGFGVLTSKLIDVNASFQTLKTSLKTVTGSSEEAAIAFDRIEQFATTTPFDLEQVASAFIKLKAFGLDPSERALTAYGNTAAAMGRSLDQMIEAVADAATGEFERLKEFGIRASAEGDRVRFTFRGVTTEVGKNAEEITKFLQAIGETEFGGAMADQMGNLAPAFSNLRAAVRGLMVDVGESGLNDTITELTNATTRWINSLDSSKIVSFTRSALGGFASAIELIQDAIDWIGRITSDARLSRGLPGEGQIPAGSPDYQLGDLSRANPRNFEQWAEALRENTGEQKKRAGKADEANNLLREIVNTIRNQENVAVTG